MSNKSYIKCLECHHLNLDSDYCNNCGIIINVVLKRKLEQENKIQIKIEKDKALKLNKIDEFLKKVSEHPNIFLRFFSQIIYSIWLFLAMILGGLIAAVVAIAAG